MLSSVEYITIRGYKSIRSIDKLALRHINILIGCNGSGKSNFIGAFSFLNAIRRGQLRNFVGQQGGAENLLHFGSKVTERIEIEVSFNDGLNGYEIALVPTAGDLLHVDRERCWYWDRERYPAPYDKLLAGPGTEAAISLPQSRTAGWVQARLESWRVYHFHDTSASSPMKKTARVDDNRFLRPDGSNLPAYLYLLRQRYASEYASIRQVVRHVAPFFDDFELDPLELDPTQIRLEWRHRDTDRYFSADSLSDGTLRFICLATLFLQPARLAPSVILLDEPELGLHPYAIAKLSALMKSASHERQVIVSTQSSLLLDHFEPEDVLVADLAEGATQLRRLESAGLEQWLDEYSLGQLWEKNQFGGRPGDAAIAGPGRG